MTHVQRVVDAAVTAEKEGHDGVSLYHQRIGSDCGEQVVLMGSLLWLMAHNDNTSVASRGGMQGLRWLQRYSR